MRLRSTLRRWAVLSIWEAHQVAGEVQGVDLEAGPEQVLVRRSATGLVLEQITAADLALLTALHRGDTLGEAFDAALDGALLHGIRTPLGYWEAKDADDDLEAEMAAKFRKG